MSTYTVQSGDSLSRIARREGLSLNALLALNPEFKANPGDIQPGDVLQLSSGTAPPTAAKSKAKKPKAQAAATAGTAGASQPPATGDFRVPRGQITFDSEGLENAGGRFHSRVLHVPSDSSGATIGRGYDMKERSQDGILQDMLAAGISDWDAKKLAGLNGLVGPAAQARIASAGLRGLEITPRQQKNLFLLTYDELAGDVKRICRKADVVAKYGATDWEQLNPTLKDVLVDLRYRGDYTGSTRQKLQGSVVRNDLGKFREILCNESYWVRSRRVPQDRFDRRKAFVMA
jgi:hypothetical protein